MGDFIIDDKGLIYGSLKWYLQTKYSLDFHLISDEYIIRHHLRKIVSKSQGDGYAILITGHYHGSYHRYEFFHKLGGNYFILKENEGKINYLYS